MKNFISITWSSIFISLALIIGPISASAVTIPKPVVSTAVQNVSGFDTFTATETEFPYYISGSISWSEMPPPPYSYDVYFGALAPNGHVYSWGAENHYQLSEGWLPFAVGQTATTFSTASFTGNRVQPFFFSSLTPPGMYLVFLIVTSTGADPSNPRNWAYASTRPVFFLPTTSGQ